VVEIVAEAIPRFVRLLLWWPRISTSRPPWACCTQV